MSCEHEHYGEEYCGNLFFRKSGYCPAGKTMPRHSHNFDHVTILFQGSLRIARGEEVVELTAPAHILIKAGIEHEITALEDDTVYWCVYAHRTPQGEVSQEVTGWFPAYV